MASFLSLAIEYWLGKWYNTIMEYNTTKLTKDEYLNSVTTNLANSENSETILKEFSSIFDLFTSKKYIVAYNPLFRDTRYYDIKNKDLGVIGQIFCSNNQSLIYLLNDDYELKINFNKSLNNENCTVKEIKYNLLNKIYEDDYVLIECLDRLDRAFRPLFHLELNGKKYYASQVVETKEIIIDNKYINTDATLYDYEYYMYDCDYKSFHAIKDKNSHQILLESSDSLNGYARVIKNGDTVPPIKISGDSNTFLKFNFEEFVDNFLNSKELQPDTFVKHIKHKNMHQEFVGANIYVPIEE